jgi:hypothetical protein
MGIASGDRRGLKPANLGFSWGLEPEYQGVTAPALRLSRRIFGKRTVEIFLVLVLVLVLDLVGFDYDYDNDDENDVLRVRRMSA